MERSQFLVSWKPAVVRQRTTHTRSNKRYLAMYLFQWLHTLTRSIASCGTGCKIPRELMSVIGPYNANSLGLSWSKIKPKKKTLDAYRLKAIPDFLIESDLVYKSILSGDSDFVYVFTDESYVHQGHAMDHTYLPKDDKAIERKTSKVRRPIILHAITTDGPLRATEENRKPIDDLLWKGDTCHPTARANGKLSCETL
jgi:hypothetical protein